ncbi:neuronal pentraxin receptor [Paramormyrops kingsleyae]|uniref:Neuronal pentraxin receptor b n=1 Tax=Paramormyrops kingsleyae TaxID=1676925 RepID=A0A3B3RLL2_9TELE|nr:neuronal pentraxin receptor [Paramormyrops kingsleyae]XP_023670200.1 neuronal pentraxin receptor [Paramormyrops kingsleyae]
MLAFLGAVICIIASVYPSSTAAAPQPLADNHSLAPDLAHRPLSPGPVAHAGPLGALHGPESLDGGGVGIGLETPAINELSSSGRAGVGKGQQFSFSRLICTPVPIGDCKSKKQADDPSLYADEEWGSFLSTAEQLRQTIQQQKEQILMDQRTIRELTGKLSECESGLEERSLQERSVGPSGRRRLMAGDDVKPSAAEHLQTALAVEELERAILQLKDRIEMLESELGPTVHNRTEVGGKGPVHSTSSGGAFEAVRWRVESLEQELERKLEMLEKERAQVHKAAHDGRHEIDEGLEDLQHRILELEQSLSEYSYPEGYKLSFPIRTNYMYAMVRRPVPELYAFTACLWLRPSGGGIGTPFSYSVVGQPNELVLLQGVHTPVELLINDKVAQLPLSLPQGKWQHVCVSWSLRDGVWKAYQGGKLKGEGAGLAAWHPIRPGGVLILGQEQDTLGGRFDAAQALVGELAQFNLWDRVLAPSEVSGLADCSQVTLGNVVPWTERDVDVLGGATKEPLEPCSQRADGQQ